MNQKELSESIDKLKRVRDLTEVEIPGLVDKPLRVLKEKRKKTIGAEYPGCLCEDPNSGRWEDLNYYCPHHGR